MDETRESKLESHPELCQAPYSGEIGSVEPVDVAAKFIAALDRSVVGKPITDRETQRVRWKADLIVLPLIAGTVIISAVDKVIISNALILGMGDDLHLVNQEYSWVGRIFYFGFLAFEWPSAYLIQRLPVGKLLAGLVFCWAVLLCCMAAARGFATLAVIRFIMGCSEAGAFPIASIITVMWYSKSEQPIRVAIWYNQFSAIVSGTVSYGISRTHTSLARWQLLFIVIGSGTALWALVILALMPDNPVTAWWLSERERYVAVRHVQANDTGIEDKQIKWWQLRECLMDPKAWLIALFACGQSIPNGGLVTFSSIIVSGLGYSTSITTLLGIPTGVVATAWQILLAVPCAKLENTRCMVIAAANVVPITCAILMWQLPRENKRGLLAAYYMFYTYWGGYVMSTSLPMANVSGHTKKVTMNAMFFLAYCLGNIIGPQVFQASAAPNYTPGYIGLLACLLTSSLAIFLYGSLCHVENARRDRLSSSNMSSAELESTTTIEAFDDRTDKQKLAFRYTY